MKHLKLFVALFAMLALGVTNAWAEEVEMSSFSATSADMDSYISYTTAKGGGTSAPAVNNNQIRLYQGEPGGNITVSAKEGTKITEVTIGSAMKTAIRWQIDNGTTDASNTDLAANAKVTKSGLSASAVTCHCYGTNKDTRLYVNYLKVVYTVETGVTPEPEPEPTTTNWVATDIANISATDVVVVTMSSGSTTWALTSANGSSSAPTAVVVTVANDGLTEEPADALKWNISNTAGSLTIYPNGTTAKWLYCTSSNNGVRVGDNTNKIFTIDAESGYLKHTATSRYIGVYNSQDWRCYTNTTGNTAGQTLKFYKYVEPTSGGEGEEPTIDAPTFSLAAGKYNEEQEVTLSAEEGTIYYTLDGTTPTADSEEYTEAIVLDECGEITIKAIAISGETTSSVASATYTIKLPLNNSQANPYTEAEAIAVYDGGCYDNQEVYVKGVVANAQFYSSNTYTITLEDGFLFYYFYEAAGDTQFTEDYIETGDTLVACGKLDNYKGTYQLAKGCYLVERKAYSVPKVDISNTPETAYTVAEAIALIDNVTSDLTKQVYVKGEIFEVESFNDNYGNITYWIQDEEGNKFECYGGLGLNQEQFTSIDDLVVGSQVVVYGTMKKYNSIYEFNHSNYIVSLTLPSYTVTVTVNDEEFGSVQGLAAGGKYEHGTIATLTAVANDGYEFISWTVNDEVVSDDASIQVEVISDWNVVANFDYVYESVFFINTKEWDEVWVYVWNETGNNGWPGLQLDSIATFFGYDIYGVAYPVLSEITNVIFNNGQGGEDNQTDDLVWTPDNFYMIDGWYTADELNNLPFTVTGSSTSLFGSEWDPSNTANDMVEQADGTTYLLVKENVTLAAGNIEYKVAVNHSWAWFTYPEEGNVTLNIPVSGRYNVTFTLDLETAEVTATAELLEEVVVLPAIAVKGAWDGWANTTPLVLADNNATASVVITISTVGDYEFGINVDGQFTANGAHVTRDANDVAGLEGNSGNMTLSVDKAGDYTFTWTYATKTLVITFPTVEPEVPTALDNIDSTVAPVKAIVNGQLIIIKNGVQYNAQGQVVK